VTGLYICGANSIAVPAERRHANGKAITIRGAREHNLKDIDATFPLGLLTVVTGVSGSGKSTLVDDILYRALARHLYGSLTEPGAYTTIEGLEHIDKVIEIDQSPIGRTPRSNPATYTGLFTPIRELYSMLPESRERGYKPGRFSFNVKGGRCEACEGDGMKRIEMNFLPDVYVLCDVCRGARYNRETLSVKYKGKSIAELLDATVEEALPLLETFRRSNRSCKPCSMSDSATSNSANPRPRFPAAKHSASNSPKNSRSARRGAPFTFSMSRPPACTSRTYTNSRRAPTPRLPRQHRPRHRTQSRRDKSADHILDLGPKVAADASSPQARRSRPRQNSTGQALRPLLNGHVAVTAVLSASVKKTA
jgi:excinuclease ABC subunit A